MKTKDMRNGLKVEVSGNLRDEVQEKIKKIKRGIVITPPTGEDLWVARVHLFGDRYVQAFQKFFKLGIGFAQEENWNINLPYIHAPAEEICEHIWHNHKYKEITKERTIRAINLLKKTCKELDNLVYPNKK